MTRRRYLKNDGTFITVSASDLGVLGYPTGNMDGLLAQVHIHLVRDTRYYEL